MYVMYLQNANTSARIDKNINNHLHDMYDKYIHICICTVCPIILARTVIPTCTYTFARFTSSFFPAFKYYTPSLTACLNPYQMVHT